MSLKYCIHCGNCAGPWYQPFNPSAVTCADSAACQARQERLKETPETIRLRVERDNVSIYQRAPFTLWAGPQTQVATRYFPGKPPFPLPKRSRSVSDYKTAVKGILSGLEQCPHASQKSWRKIAALVERFNVPAYARDWASGYRDARHDAWYRSGVEFLYIMPDGTRVKYESASNAQKEYIHSLTSDRTRYAAGHFWIKSKQPFN